MKGETIIRRSATGDDNDSLRSYHRQEEQDHPNNHTQRVADQGESRKSEFGRAIFSLLMPPASGVPSLVRILSSQFRSARGTAFPLSSLRTPFEKGSPQEDGGGRPVATSSLSTSPIGPSSSRFSFSGVSSAARFVIDPQP